MTAAARFAVRRVLRPHRRYLVRRPAVSDAVLSTGGRLVVRSSSARGADPCAADRETETIDFALAGPGHPGLRPLAGDVTNSSPYAAYGTAVAAGMRRPGCPATYQTSVFAAGPTTTFGPVTNAPVFAIDIDGHEVAVQEDTTLRRYPR